MEVIYRNDFSIEDVLTYLTQVNPVPDNVFLSESWISSWLASLSTYPTLCLMYEKTSLKGFVFIGVSHKQKFCFRWKRGYLNQLGNMQDDQIWIEHNAIICQPSDTQACLNVLLDTVFSALEIKELIISLATPHFSTLLLKNAYLVEAEACNSYVCKLDNLYTLDDTLKKLSSNSRSQIRRAINRTVKMYGSIEITTATSFEEQSEYLKALGAFHREQWAQTAEGSGFNNPTFNQFHESLNKAKQRVTLTIKVSAGNHTLGFAHYLVNKDKILFYCSGINHQQTDPKCKPGYLLHVYAIHHFANAGFKEYDLLGGDSQYKNTLSNKVYQMYTCVLTSNDIMGQLLRLGKRLLEKTRLIGLS